jgi:hypothetical protein
MNRKLTQEERALLNEEYSRLGCTIRENMKNGNDAKERGEAIEDLKIHWLCEEIRTALATGMCNQEIEDLLQQVKERL